MTMQHPKCYKRETSLVMFDMLTLVSGIVFDIRNFGLHLLSVTTCKVWNLCQPKTSALSTFSSAFLIPRVKIFPNNLCDWDGQT